MAAVSFPLTSISQETGSQSFTGQASSNTTLLNPNQAQGTPDPQDTITLSGRAALGQQTRQSQQEPLFQQTVILGAEAQVFNDASSAGSPQSAANAPVAQQPTSGGHANLATSAATAQAISATGAANSTGAIQQTQQQQLRKLDQTLEQLGINPQSIGLFSQLELLGYANDPSALQQIIQQGTSATQTKDQGQGAGGDGVQLADASAAASLPQLPLLELQAASGANTAASQGSLASAGSSFAAQGSTASPGFQATQLRVPAVDGQLLPSTSQPLGSGAQGQSLNVTF